MDGCDDDKGFPRILEDKVEREITSDEMQNVKCAVCRHIGTLPY